MKFTLKKYIYLLNDLTNLLLKKETEDYKSRLKNLVITLIIVIILFIASLFFNVYLVTGV